MRDDERRSWADAYAVFAFLQRFQWVVQILVFFACITMIIWGVFANRRKALEAAHPVEATFWYIRYLSCCIGTYGLAYSVLLFVHAHAGPLLIMEYWPLIDMLWVDHSWFGDYKHSEALYGEPMFIAVLAFLIRAVSRVYGSYDDTFESFKPTHFAMRQWLDQEILKLQLLHPENNGRFWALPDAEKTRSRQEWRTQYGFKYDQLRAERATYAPGGEQT